MANLILRPAAQREVDQLPKVIRARVFKLIERLKDWPDVSGAKPLTGNLAGKYRMRTGDYRVRFSIVGETVIIERIGHRDRFYGG